MKHTIIFSLLTIGLFEVAQAQQDHQAWMDSIKSDSYIGMELTLDELVLEDRSDSLKYDGFAFYKTNPLNSTDEVLSRLSGVSMMRRGNYAWEPTINGLSSGQINVTIDGMRIFGACTDRMDPVSSYVETNNLESVEVKRGCGGSEYGSTVGGAVDFDLKKPVFNQPISLSLGERFESAASGWSHTASLNYGKKNLAIRINGSIRDFQNYTDGNGDEVFPSGYHKKNLSIGAAYRLKPNALLNLDLLVDDARDIGYPGLPMDVAFAKANMAAISYLVWPKSPRVTQIEIKGYANTVDHLMDDSQRENLQIRMDMPGDTKTVGAFAKVNLKTDEKHLLTAKIDGYSTNAYAEMTMSRQGFQDMFMVTWPNVNRHDIGIYLADHYQVIKNLSINTNLRAEYAYSTMKSEDGQRLFGGFNYEEKYFNRNDWVINAGTNFDYQLGQKLLTNLSVGWGERLPTTSELYGFFLYNSNEGFDYIGKPDLKKEQSTQITASIYYKPGYKFKTRASGFHYWFSDYIFGAVDDTLDPMLEESNGVKVYDNINGVTFKGYELQSTWAPLKQLQLIHNLKVTYAEDKMGNPLPLIPPMKNYLTAVYANKGFTIRTEGEWSSRQNRNSELAGEIPTTGYFLLHLRLNKTFEAQTLKWQAAIGVENLLDEAYRDHLDWGGILRPGRNIYASLNVRF